MVVVRRFEPHDEPCVVRLWQRVFADDPPHNAPAVMLASKLAHDDLVFVAEDAGDIVGACMAGYDGHRGWVYAVAVSPEVRGRGVGSLLMDHVIEELRTLGCVKLNLQVRADNESVVKFYESLGFSVEARVSMGKLLS
ncbi:MAG: GNAT family acetyltransferase [Pseudomonadales bacterium]|nr:GNAT family acetyltransferase [Pseudomonadales bacterium]